MSEIRWYQKNTRDGETKEGERERERERKEENKNQGTKVKATGDVDSGARNIVSLRWGWLTEEAVWDTSYNNQPPSKNSIDMEMRRHGAHEVWYRMYDVFIDSENSTYVSTTTPHLSWRVMCDAFAGWTNAYSFIWKWIHCSPPRLLISSLQNILL